jgi:hypothetical protein
MKKQETEQKDNTTQANEPTMEQRTDIIRDMIAAQNRTALRFSASAVKRAFTLCPA